MGTTCLHSTLSVAKLVVIPASHARYTGGCGVVRLLSDCCNHEEHELVLDNSLSTICIQGSKPDNFRF